MRALLSLLSSCLLALPACSLNRAAIGTPSAEASLPDASEWDAPLDDAPRLDAPMPDDVGSDTGPACTPTSPTEIACDRVDEDCDGVVDDGVCGACTAFTALGQPYLSCPAPVTGDEAWTGACRRLAPGYDIVSFSGLTEQNAVLGALAARGISDAHWIGLNDFDVNGAYVWRDRSTTFTPTAIGANDPALRFVSLRADGTYEQQMGTTAHRILCEPIVSMATCGGRAETASCDGVDDDCDGLVDEGAPCGMSTCTGRTFWDHVYYLCTRMRNRTEATTECLRDTGGPLVSIHGPVEHAFLAQTSPADAWIGLTQDMSAGAPEANWHWLDASSYGVPCMHGVAPWDPPEPNDGGSATENNQENCGTMLSPARGSHFDDRGCNANLTFICARTWSY